MRRIAAVFSLLCCALLSKAQLTPIPMGSASNVYTILLDEQNQVAASDDLNSVVFIHRQDTSAFGGTTADNGRMRYDLSTDGGITFTNDIGTLNPTYTRPARYPSCTFYNPTGGNNPFNAYLVWGGPSLDTTPQWDGHAVGVADITLSNPTTKEHYKYIGESAYIPGGLCQGLPGEFWMVDREFINPPGTFGDSLFIYKGVWDTATNDVNWSRFLSVLPPHYTPTNFTYFENPNIAFSPDGMTGWIAWIGDVTSGPDSLRSPVFMKSTDGGATWGTAFDVDMSVVPWIDDSLITLNGGSGIPSMGVDYDLIVDSAGNPHMFAPIFNGPTPGGSYSFFTNQGKFMGDVTTPDGGQSWTVRYIAPALTYSFTYGTTPNFAAQSNRPQVSRTEDGSRIFYTWVDTDTNGGLWGTSQNTAPDLMTSAVRISDGYQTCFKNITRSDTNWHGKVQWPTASPTVLTKQGGEYSVPVVSALMPGNDPIAITDFYYWGNHLVWNDSMFLDPQLLNLGWNGPCPGCPSPIVSFGSQVTGQSVTFTDSSGVNPTSWLWDFGDGSSDSTQNTSHTYQAVGTYTVCLTATNTCGSKTVCDSITINCINPTAAYSHQVGGATVQFTDTTAGGPMSWQWNFGDGNTSTSQNPSHTFNPPGTYWVCLIVSNLCGVDTICDSVTSCVVPASNYSFIVNGNQVTFSDTSSNATSWSWDFGDGNTSSQQNPIHNYTFQGTFNVCLTAINPCGTDTFCQTVVVCDIASAFTYQVTGASAVFTDGSNGTPTSWNWDFGDGNQSTQPSPFHTYSTSGTYTVCLTVTNACGTDSSCQTLQVTVGIEDQKPFAIDIFPNPVSDVLAIRAVDWVAGEVEIGLVDALGNEVLPTMKIDQNGRFELELSTAQLAKGMYFLRVKFGDRNADFPVVKE